MQIWYTFNIIKSFMSSPFHRKEMLPRKIICSNWKIWFWWSFYKMRWWTPEIVRWVDEREGVEGLLCCQESYKILTQSTCSFFTFVLHTHILYSNFVTLTGWGGGVLCSQESSKIIIFILFVVWLTHFF